MTATESFALPEREADTHEPQPVPMLTAERATDPGYIYARIQEMLTESADRAAAHISDDNNARRALELELLRDRLTRFADGLHAYSAAGDEFLARLTDIAPEIYWVRIEGGAFVGNTRYGQPLETGITAARTLGLAEEGTIGKTIRFWCGRVEGWPVQITHYD